MNNAITTLRIQNFKSIKDVEMKPRRVNILIGEPNVGKSNILEALSLLGGMFFDGDKFMAGQIRYEAIRNLFYDNDWSQEIIVTGEGVGATRIRKRQEQVEVAFGNGEERVIPQTLPSAVTMLGGGFAGISQEAMAKLGASLRMLNVQTGDITGDDLIVDFESFNQLHELINKDGSTTSAQMSSSQPPIRVKKYAFQKQTTHGKSYNNSFLRPPFGDNLLEVIQSGTSAFRKEIAAFFTPAGLSLALRPEEQKLEIQKNVDGVITSIPYSLIADTLQRLIFYLAAIESNTDSVLLFEEPEAHSHPEYVAQLGQRIVSSRDNQFFVATHSTYLITEILEEMLTNDELRPELAMFAVYYENYQTKVRQLSDEDVLNIRRDGLDVFYNMARFVPVR